MPTYAEIEQAFFKLLTTNEYIIPMLIYQAIVIDSALLRIASVSVFARGLSLHENDAHSTYLPKSFL